MPAGLGGEVGGANATTTLLNPLNPPPERLLATAGVVALRIVTQFCPPSVDCTTPTPVTPAYKMRAAVGEGWSRTNERTSPKGAVPWVQFSPPSVETKRPRLDAR